MANRKPSQSWDNLRFFWRSPGRGHFRLRPSSSEQNTRLDIAAIAGRRRIMDCRSGVESSWSTMTGRAEAGIALASSREKPSGMALSPPYSAEKPAHRGWRFWGIACHRGRSHRTTVEVGTSCSGQGPESPELTPGRRFSRRRETVVAHIPSFAGRHRDRGKPVSKGHRRQWRLLPCCTCCFAWKGDPVDNLFEPVKPMAKPPLPVRDWSGKQ
jgi:hypothetical protein